MGFFPQVAAAVAAVAIVGGLGFEAHSGHFTTSPSSHVATGATQTAKVAKHPIATVAKITLNTTHMSTKIGDSVTIRGKALNAQGHGIANAKLKVVGLPNHPQGYTIHTTSNGQFIVSSKWNSAGNYNVNVGSGLASNSVAVAVIGSSKPQTPLVPAKVVVDASPSSAQVGQPVTITVKFLTLKGQDVPNTTFTLDVPGNVNYGTEQTNSSGAFTTTATWSTPGTYTITAGTGKISWNTTVTVK